MALLKAASSLSKNTVLQIKSYSMSYAILQSYKWMLYVHYPCTETTWNKIELNGLEWHCSCILFCTLLGLNGRKMLLCTSFHLLFQVPCYKLVNMARTHNSLEDLSAKEAHSIHIPVIYRLPGNQVGHKGQSQWQIMNLMWNVHFG